MRLWSLAAAIACVVFALAGSAAIDARSGAIDDAASAAFRLERLEEVRVAAVEADSIATTSFLVGGLEDPVRRARFEDRLAVATETLTAVAAAGSDTDRSGEEADALSTANAALNRFAGLIEQARSNNRQALPVGAAYQREASTLMRDVVVAELDIADAIVRDDVNSAVRSSRSAAYALHISALAAIAVLIGASVWMARRTSRFVNLGLAGSLLAILVIWAFSGPAMASAQSAVDDTASGPLSVLDQLGQGRAAAFDARSLEALTLISRGSGGAYQTQWVGEADLASRQLDGACKADSASCSPLSDFERYRGVHDEVRVLDDAGKWDDAVALALGSEPGGGAASFESFAASSDAASTAAAAAVDTGFDDAAGSVTSRQWLVLVGGLVAAGAAIGGIAQRIREYR